MAFSCHFPNSSNFDQPFFRQKCHTKREREKLRKNDLKRKNEKDRESERERGRKRKR